MTLIMADEKRKPGRPKGSKKSEGDTSRRSGKPLQVYLDDGLNTLVSQLLREIEPRISKTAYIEALIRADMRARGKLPPRGEAPAK